MLVIALCMVVLLFREELLRARSRTGAGVVDEVRILQAVAADLRSGSSVRSALDAVLVTEHDPDLRLAHRLVAAGAPLTEVATVLEGLPANGMRVGAALRVVAVSGGSSAAVFAGIADQAVAERQLERERRASTAQARLSAVVVGGLPLVLLLLGGWGRVRVLVSAGSVGVAVALTAMSMLVGGSLVVWLMARS